ncbi:hypothetical protein DENSPDRAFT_836856 [Dentipellis sp. KUC8613]|nr:hypothetical protein DENSPDRAFT_836856 [Dentipellis sp. KUC8613]
MDSSRSRPSSYALLTFVVYNLCFHAYISQRNHDTGWDPSSPPSATASASSSLPSPRYGRSPPASHLLENLNNANIYPQAFVTTFEFMMDVITGIVCCRGFAGTRQAPPPPGKKNRKGMGMGIGASGFSAGVY